MKPIKRPTREPLTAFERPSDGELVEVWATKHTQRSHDRVLDGRTYYRALVFIGGGVYDHMPVRHGSPEDAARFVRRQFRGLI